MSGLIVAGRPGDAEWTVDALSSFLRATLGTDASADTLAVEPQGWIDHLWVPHRDAMIRIETRDIDRIEAEGDYVRIVTGGASHLLHGTMARLAERLDPELFAHVRRSLIVRADLLAEVAHLGGGV